MRYGIHQCQLFSLVFSLVIVFCSAIYSTSVNAQASSPAEAAREARERTGGKVLKVKSTDRGQYRVKVLMPGGQVKNINIKKKSK